MQAADCVSPDILHSLLYGLQMDAETQASMCVIEVQPVGDFITYGVGVPLMTMRHTDQARG